MLRILAARGGKRRKLTTAAMKEQRAQIAKAIDMVVELMYRENDHVRFIDVEDALFWTRPGGFDVQSVVEAQEKGIPLRQYFDNRNSETGTTAPKLLTSALGQRVGLTRLLNAVSYQLKYARPLGWLDDIAQKPLVQPGRSERTHLEHVLAHQLAYLARPLPAGLIAPAIEVALELPPASVNVKELAERLRKIYEPPQRKSSAKKRKT
jgi:hypothetical protein